MIRVVVGIVLMVLALLLGGLANAFQSASWQELICRALLSLTVLGLPGYLLARSGFRARKRKAGAVVPKVRGIVRLAFWLTYMALFAMMVWLSTTEPVAWSSAKSSDRIKGYESYIANFPGGDHAQEALSRLDALKAEAAVREAKLEEERVGRVAMLDRICVAGLFSVPGQGTGKYPPPYYIVEFTEKKDATLNPHIFGSSIKCTTSLAEARTIIVYRYSEQEVGRFVKKSLLGDMFNEDVGPAISSKLEACFVDPQDPDRKRVLVAKAVPPDVTSGSAGSQANITVTGFAGEEEGHAEVESMLYIIIKKIE